MIVYVSTTSNMSTRQSYIDFFFGLFFSENPPVVHVKKSGGCDDLLVRLILISPRMLFFFLDLDFFFFPLFIFFFFSFFFFDCPFAHRLIGMKISAWIKTVHSIIFECVSQATDGLSRTIYIFLQSRKIYSCFVFLCFVLLTPSVSCFFFVFFLLMLISFFFLFFLKVYVWMRCLWSSLVVDAYRSNVVVRKNYTVISSWHRF